MPLFNISSRKTSTNTSVGGFLGHFVTLVNMTQDSYFFEINFYVKWKEILKNQLLNYSIKAYNFDLQQGENPGTFVDSKSANSVRPIGSISGGDTIKSWILSAKNTAEQVSIFQNAKIKDTGIIPLFTGEDVDIYKKTLVNYQNSGGKIDYVSNTDFQYLVLAPQKNPASNLTNFSTNNEKVTNSKIKSKNLELISRHLTDPAEIFDFNFAPGGNQNLEYNSKISLCKSISEFYLNTSPYNLPKESTYFGCDYSQSAKIKNHFVSKVIEIKKEYVKNYFEFVVTLYYTPTGPKPASNGKNYYGSFELPKKNVDIAKHLRFYNAITKNKPTLISTTKDPLGNKSISVQSNAPSANSIKLYTKQINSSGYCFNFSTPVSKVVGPSPIIAPVFQQSGDFQIYRAFAENTSLNIISQKFNSTVVGNPVKKIDTTILLFRQRNGYLEIEVKNMPDNVTALFLESSKQTVGGGFEHISTEKIAISSISSYIHKHYGLENKKIYKYSVSYQTNDGTIKKSVSSYYKYFNASTETSISTLVTNVSVGIENNQPAISFEINSTSDQNESDSIANFLQQTSLGVKYSSELLKLKDKFGHVLSHIVYRTNLNSGIREVFTQLGTITAANQAQVFSDDYSTRKKANVVAYDLSSPYLYEISVLKHDPTVVLRDFIIDEKTEFNKKYQYKPYRWRQARTREEGTFYAEDQAGNLLGFSQLEADEIGITQIVSVPPETKLLEIGQPYLERIDSRKVKISWNVQADPRSYDHFVVIKEVNGNKKVLGCFMNNEIIDILNVEQPSTDTSKSDFGTLLYYVTPVLSDFSVLPTLRTNAIIVDPEEFRYKSFLVY
jgi:hypothetical protein